MESEKTVPAPRLPLMRTFEDAVALSEKEEDSFYLSAFVFQCWLGDLVCQTIAEYAEKKNPKDRVLQSGQAWQGFLKLFGHAEDKEYPILLLHLFRFARHQDPLASILRHALDALSVEHDITGEYFGPDAILRTQQSAFSTSMELVRSSLARWCDWLDALIHFQTHQHWHLAPVCFDPDPEKRELAALGVNERHLAHLDVSAKGWWLGHFYEAAERFKDSPKWPNLGRAMSAESDRLWPYAEVDAAIIGLWPLVKQHNWTYRDLMNVVRLGVKRPEGYPCDTEQSLASYCPTVLGLRKTGKGVSARNGKPAGYGIAMRLLEQKDAKRTKPE